jgi:hypothetical protein
MPYYCCSANSFYHDYHQKCRNAIINDKLEQLDRLEKIRDANGRLRSLVKQVDDLSLETQFEIDKAYTNASSYWSCAPYFNDNHCVHVEEHHHHHHHHHVYDGNVYPLSKYPTASYKHCATCGYCRQQYLKNNNRSKSVNVSGPWIGGPYVSNYPWKNSKKNSK